MLPPCIALGGMGPHILQPLPPHGYACQVVPMVPAKPEQLPPSSPSGSQSSAVSFEEPLEERQRRIAWIKCARAARTIHALPLFALRIYTQSYARSEERRERVSPSEKRDKEES